MSKQQVITFQVIVMQDVLATGYPVDMVVAPDRLTLVEGALKRANIDYKIGHTNVKR